MAAHPREHCPPDACNGEWPSNLRYKEQHTLQHTVTPPLVTLLSTWLSSCSSRYWMCRGASIPTIWTATLSNTDSIRTCLALLRDFFLPPTARPAADRILTQQWIIYTSCLLKIGSYLILVIGSQYKHILLVYYSDLQASCNAKVKRVTFMH